MKLTRRSTLSLAGASALLPSLAMADTVPFTETKRSLGSANAPVTVEEFFSLTCPHCAEFATSVLPQVKAKLIDTGKVQFIFHDYPLDQVALKAAQVARYLPLASYYPFIEALFASQNNWAFKDGVDYKTELFAYAALAGMSRPTYDQAWNDVALGTWILKGEQEAEQLDGINATPTFLINGRKYEGASDYATFASLVAKA